MKKENLFKTKKITGLFALIALIGGSFFINRNLTGNVVRQSSNPIELLSIIGLLLISCSVILAAYSIKRK